jgi:probable F420-dependent oxidoreductase
MSNTILAKTPRLGLAITLSHIEGLSGRRQQHLLELARMADQAGVDQIVLSEHVTLAGVITGHPGSRPGEVFAGSFFPSDEEYPDPFVALAAIAAVTETARLSTNILIAPLRPPVLLAKMAATLDVISGGRLDLGVGTGWHREEFAALGVPFRHLAQRMDETIQACQALWRGGPTSFESETVSFSDMYCSPTPAQARIPIWFGGAATEAMARRVTETGDGWTPIGNTSIDDVALGVALIKQHCSRIGRDPGTIAVRCSLPLRVTAKGRGDITQTVAAAGDLAAAGATIVQLPPLKRFVKKLDDVRPLLVAAKECLPEHIRE